MKALPPPEALPPPQGQPLLRPQGHFASPLPLGSVPPVQALPRPPPGAPPQLPPGWYVAESPHGRPPSCMQVLTTAPLPSPSGTWQLPHTA